MGHRGRTPVRHISHAVTLMSSIMTYQSELEYVLHLRFAVDSTGRILTAAHCHNVDIVGFVYLLCIDTVLVLFFLHVGLTG